MTIEKTTTYFGCITISKVLKPGSSLIMENAPTGSCSRNLVRQVEILPCDSIKLTISLKRKPDIPSPFWLLTSRQKRHSNEGRFFSVDDINREQLESRSFRGLKRERITWKP